MYKLKQLWADVKHIVRTIKCMTGHHHWGSFWKDGWIPPQLVRFDSREVARELRICRFCGHTEYRNKEQ